MRTDQKRKAKPRCWFPTSSSGRLLEWFGACLAGATVLVSLPAVADNGCEWAVISETDSPSGEWSAIIRQAYCSNALASSVTEIVQIVRAGQAIREEEGEVLATDDGGHERERPVLTWISAKTLQIEVPNLSYLGRFKKEYQGIKIVLKYNPDDPAAREIFYKRYGITPP